MSEILGLRNTLAQERIGYLKLMEENARLREENDRLKSATHYPARCVELAIELKDVQEALAGLVEACENKYRNVMQLPISKQANTTREIIASVAQAKEALGGGGDDEMVLPETQR